MSHRHGHPQELRQEESLGKQAVRNRPKKRELHTTELLKAIFCVSSTKLASSSSLMFLLAIFLDSLDQTTLCLEGCGGKGSTPSPHHARGKDSLRAAGKPRERSWDPPSRYSRGPRAELPGGSIAFTTGTSRQKTASEYKSSTQTEAPDLCPLDKSKYERKDHFFILSTNCNLALFHQANPVLCRAKLNTGLLKYVQHCWKRNSTLIYREGRS